MINFDQKQRINLSSRTIDILELDAEAFCGGLNRTGFINELLRRCTAGSPASIDLACVQYRRNLEGILKESLKKSEMESDLTQRGMDALVKEHELQLSERALSWPKGESILFRLSNDNCRAFYSDYDQEPLYPVPACYQGKVSRYLKAVLEEYCSHTMYERESLFFHEEISMIRMAMTSEKLLRMTSAGAGGRPGTFDVRVYDILADDSGLYHYIVGMVAPSYGTKKEEHIASLRLSRIRQIRVPDGPSVRSGHISSAQKKQIADRIRHSRVQFLASDREDIVVRFSKAGRDMYQRVLYMRPKADYTDEEGNDHFSCSYLQAEYYFEKFGAEAEVISPVSLRAKFASGYEKAHELYGSSPSMGASSCSAGTHS